MEYAELCHWFRFVAVPGMKIVSARKPCMVYAFDLADCSKSK